MLFRTAAKGDPQLLDALQRSAGRKMSPEEKRQQRVSFIMGTMGDDNTITRQEIEKILDEQDG